MAANKVNPLVKALQIPEGFTTRKVKGVLRVVPAKPRKAAIVKKKIMLKGVRVEDKCYKEMDWQESAIQTIKENNLPFTVDELFDAIQSVRLEKDDLEGMGCRKDTLQRYVNGWTHHPFNQWLEKVSENTYQMRKRA